MLCSVHECQDPTKKKKKKSKEETTAIRNEWRFRCELMNMIQKYECFMNFSLCYDNMTRITRAMKASRNLKTFVYVLDWSTDVVNTRRLHEFCWKYKSHLRLMLLLLLSKKMRYVPEVFPLEYRIVKIFKSLAKLITFIFWRWFCVVLNKIAYRFWIQCHSIFRNDEIFHRNTYFQGVHLAQFALRSLLIHLHRKNLLAKIWWAHFKLSRKVCILKGFLMWHFSQFTASISHSNGVFCCWSNQLILYENLLKKTNLRAIRSRKKFHKKQNYLILNEGHSNGWISSKKLLAFVVIIQVRSITSPSHLSVKPLAHLQIDSSWLVGGINDPRVYFEYIHLS